MAAKCDLLLRPEATPRAQAQGKQASTLKTGMEELNWRSLQQARCLGCRLHSSFPSRSHHRASSALGGNVWPAVGVKGFKPLFAHHSHRKYSLLLLCTQLPVYKSSDTYTLSYMSTLQILIFNVITSCFKILWTKFRCTHTSSQEGYTSIWGQNRAPGTWQSVYGVLKYIFSIDLFFSFSTH